MTTMHEFRAELGAIIGRTARDVPAVFQGTRPRPLKVGIIYDLQRTYPRANCVRLREWLGRYMASRAYQQAVLYGQHRHDISGVIDGRISGKAKTAARRRLHILRLEFDAQRHAVDLNAPGLGMPADATSANQEAAHAA